MSGDEIWARRFRAAAREFSGSTPLYERLAYAVADRPAIAGLLRVAAPGQQRALLFFAAVSQVLRTIEPDHRLARWFPVLGGRLAVDDGDPGAALADLVKRRSAEITELCRTRNTQTNEARRAALLRPAMGLAARRLGRPLALLELGASAGLLLMPDRYAYHYFSLATGRDEVCGNGLTIDCEVRAGWPSPAAEPIEIASRAGIDLDPVRPDDEERIDWLRSCVWPEHVERMERLNAALELVRAARPRLVAGDFIRVMPDLLAQVDPEVTPFVFASHAMAYLSGDDRATLLRQWQDFGSTRDLVVVVNENQVAGLRMFAPSATVRSDLETQVTMVTWRDGQARVEVLCEAGPHGAYLRYQPREHAYEPLALDG